MTKERKTAFETRCVHGAYKAKSGEPQVLPIVQNTTYRYYNAKDVADLFEMCIRDSQEYRFNPRRESENYISV